MEETTQPKKVLGSEALGILLGRWRDGTFADILTGIILFFILGTTQPTCRACSRRIRTTRRRTCRSIVQTTRAFRAIARRLLTRVVIQALAIRIV